MKAEIGEQLSRIVSNIQLLSDFCEKYEKATEGIVIRGFTDEIPSVILYDAATAGEVLGKDGWTREYDRYGSYDKIQYSWVQTIDGVAVTITNAESQETLNKTPVPPKAFPIALKEVNA